MNLDKKSREQKGRRAGAFMDDDEYSEGDDVARQMRLERMRQMRGGNEDEMGGADGND